MRKLLILTAVVAVASTSVEVQAASRRVQTQLTAAQQGPFNRLMELERRKNAALKRAFLGR